MTESIIVMPIFFALGFGLLQAGYLGSALLMANYAANSVARKAVEENTADYHVISQYWGDMDKLMTGGMTRANLWGCPFDPDESTTVSKTFAVNAVVKVRAFPFVTMFLAPILHDHYDVGSNLGGCGAPPKGFGPFYFSPQHNQFLVWGKTTIRTSYQP